MPLAPTHGKSTQVLAGIYDVSQFLDSADYDISTDTPETTAFGQNARSYITGFPGGQVNLTGYMDPTTVIGSDFIFNSMLVATTPFPVTISPQGGLNGQRAFIFNGYLNNYPTNVAVNDVVRIQTQWMPSTRLGGGFVLQPEASLSAGTGAGQLNNATIPGVGSTGVDFTVTTSVGAIANLHVIANTLNTGTLACKIQDSADNVTFADVTAGAFTAITAGATGSQTLLIPSTSSVRRYVRAVSQSAAASGAATVAISLAKFFV